jgi:hypothetical protein
VQAVRDHALEARMLVLEQPQAPQLTDAEVREFLAPQVERRLADAELPTDVGNGGPALHLARCGGVSAIYFHSVLLATFAERDNIISS